MQSGGGTKRAIRRGGAHKAISVELPAPVAPQARRLILDDASPNASKLLLSSTGSGKLRKSLFSICGSKDEERDVFEMEPIKCDRVNHDEDCINV